MRTAARGDIARVDTVVAMAFAVSWKPFVKSNASAVTTTMARMRSPSTAALRVLDDDALEDVRDALRRVDRLLEPVEDVLPADHDHRVDPALEEGGDRLARHPVAVVLEPVDLDDVVRDESNARSRGIPWAIWRQASSRIDASACAWSIGASIL